MRDDIIEKLRNVIIDRDRDVITECFVVYLLIEIRKFIDTENIKDKYKMLYFYCNWVAHAELSRKDAKEILLSLNDEVINNKALVDAPNRQKLLPNFLFKNQLNEFLDTYQLPTNLFVVYNDQFILKLVDVLIDCPLVTDSDLCEITLFSFVKGDTESGINYEIKTKNGMLLKGNFFINSLL